MLNPIGTKVVNTSRFILRPFNVNDANAIFHNYGANREVTKYLNWDAYDNLEQASYVAYTFASSYGNPFYFNWAIIDRQNNALIGSIALHNIDLDNECGEIGICIAPSYWRKGVGNETMLAVIDYGFKNVGLRRVEAKVHQDNVASNALMHKLRMNHEGILLDALKKNNQFYNLNIYSLINLYRK